MPLPRYDPTLCHQHLDNTIVSHYQSLSSSYLVMYIHPYSTYVDDPYFCSVFDVAVVQLHERLDVEAGVGARVVE